MSFEPPEQKQNKKLLKVFAVSAAVLVVAVGIGLFVLFRSYQKWQNNEYWSVDMARVIRQASGFETKNLNDVSNNATIFSNGAACLLTGMWQDNWKQTDKAIASYKEALDNFSQYPGWNNIYAFDALSRRAADMSTNGKVKEGEDDYKQAVECAKKCSNAKGFLVARGLMRLGMFYSEHQRYAESRTAFQSNLEIEKAGLGPDDRTLISDYWWLGSSQARCGLRADALESIDSALRIARRQGLAQELPDLEFERGNCLAYLKRYQEAEISFAETVRLFGNKNGDFGYYQSRLFLGQAQLMNGKPDIADATVDTAVPCAGRLSRAQESEACKGIGDYFASRKLFVRAEQMYNASAVSAAASPRNDYGYMLEVVALSSLAQCLYQEKKLGQSASTFKRVIDISDEHSTKLSAVFLERAAQTFLANHQPELAAKAQMRAQAEGKTEP